MRQAHRLLAGLLAAGALLAAGCAQSVDPIERLGRKAARQVTPGAGAPGSAVHKRWGLAGPLAHAPEPPAHRLSAAYVVDRVPTRDKVVFLAFDEGAARDPRFVRMTGELKLSVSLFRAEGRPNLPTLSYERQHAEICGQRLSRLFHPPHGAYNADTLRAAADCGIRAVVLGREFRDYAQGERLRPGDIVRADASATAPLLRRIQEQGYAVGRLEDYV
ncbi:polysaccharide deacetylase family protein [Streptomyces sp. NPDC005408]|uniref:polysaccharide deacetylase family protein n=1 Tax=Streptomyces sp. NPDC005408 TaxID=3155341 RepID=UPI0033A65C3F